MKKAMMGFAGFAYLMLAAGAAGAVPVALPSPGNATPAPSSTPTPARAGLPPPKPASILAPQWAPEEAGPESATEKAGKKPSPWLSLAGLGVGVPASGGLGRAYATAFQVDLGSGLKVSDLFSAWLDLCIGIYGSKNDALTHQNNFTMIEAAFWGRYRVLSADLSPYVFAGPGLSYNEYRSSGIEQIDPVTGYAYVPVDAYEFDFLMEGGLGLDLKLEKGMSAFLQGKLVCDFTSARFAGYASTDSPIVVIPLEAGILFGI